MSQSTTTSETGAVHSHEETVHGVGHAHPSDRNYVMIALLLGVITAVEIAFYVWEDDLGAAVAPGLIIMMVVKFFIVAAWFMHLRFDSKIFSRLFIAGVALAVAVYLATLTTFQFWGSDGDSVDETEPGGSAAGLVLEGPGA